MKAIKTCLALLLAAAAFAAAGCGESGPQHLSMEFRVAEEAPGDNLLEMPAAILGRSLFLHREAKITAAHIDSATVVRQKDHYLVGVQFTPEGSALMAELTRDNVGKRIAMLVEGRIVSAPICRAPITGGRAVIDGAFSAEEAQRIADGLNGR